MRIARVDRNQKEVVELLRQEGYSVACTHMVHNGFPDLVVGYKSRNYLVELKNPNQPISQQKLTEPEERFMTRWQGNYMVATTATEIIDKIQLDFVFNQKDRESNK